jgi:hypothetical protein
MWSKSFSRKYGALIYEGMDEMGYITLIFYTRIPK